MEAMIFIIFFISSSSPPAALNGGRLFIVVCLPLYRVYYRSKSLFGVKLYDIPHIFAGGASDLRFALSSCFFAVSGK